jgi:hypothetical protein
MASQERTAYPALPRTITLKDLLNAFTPKPDEVAWAGEQARGADRKLALLVQLKCFQLLHYFLPADEIPPEIVEHVAGCLSMQAQSVITYPAAHRALYRHHEAVRKLLGVRAFAGAGARRDAVDIALTASQVVDTRSDVINIMIEQLIERGYELPAFSTLVTIAEQVHAAAQEELYMRIAQRLTQEQRDWLDKLIARDLVSHLTLYNKIKRSAKRASRSHLELLLQQLTWLESLPDSAALLEGIAPTKLRHMADMTAVMDAGDLKDFRPAKRHALILALIRQMAIRARDDIAEMFIRRMSVIHKAAREELKEIQVRQRELSEHLVATLDDVLEILAEKLDDASTGKKVREVLAPRGDLETLRDDCEAIRVWSGGNHLTLTWKPFSVNRAALFRMAKALTVGAD